MNDRIYAIRDKATGKLKSDLTNPRRKYWDRRGNAEAVLSRKIKYNPNLELVIFDLVEVKE